MNKYIVGQGKIFTGSFIKSETSEICITVINNTSDLRFNPGQEPNEEEKKIEEEAEKLGIKKKTLRNAKMELGIDSVKRGNQWYWMLSE